LFSIAMGPNLWERQRAESCDQREKQKGPYEEREERGTFRFGRSQQGRGKSKDRQTGKKKLGHAQIRRKNPDCTRLKKRWKKKKKNYQGRPRGKSPVPEKRIRPLTGKGGGKLSQNKQGP